jgi:hypothetical protein
VPRTDLVRPRTIEALPGKELSRRQYPFCPIGCNLIAMAESKQPFFNSQLSAQSISRAWFWLSLTFWKAAQLRTQVPFLGAIDNFVLAGPHSISLGIF